ncbi:shikimate dehydrogenase [Micrococcus sp. TA1]|uniref:shikimate dehydrogenase family protein n=1 Tax=Micrococcus sp. TA1 TaxID=681627 RepID=UPI00160AE2C9|nr:shikimate dehydrogenase [Micrococcus sp. TA1]
MAEPVHRWNAGVLGHPIAHSKSPDLHAAAYRVLGLDIDYRAHDVTPEHLSGFVAGLGDAAASGADWLGLSVTMPLKAPMVGLMDSVSPRVERLGVLNTVVRGADGSLSGHNTDVDGIVRSLAAAGFDRRATGGRMGILGGGGTAAAAIAAAAQLGLDGIEVFVRNPDRAVGQVTLARAFGLEAAVRTLADFPASAPGFRAVVSTLPPRAADPTAAALAAAGPAGTRGLPPLLDAAYDPWPSALAAAWSGRGGDVVSGLEMLLYQAVEQVRLFTARVRTGTAEPDWAAVTGAMAASIGLPAREPAPPAGS